MKTPSPMIQPTEAGSAVPAQSLNPNANDDGGSSTAASRVSLRTAERSQAGRSPSPYTTAMSDFTTGAALESSISVNAGRGAGSTTASGPRPRKKHKKRAPCEPKECENCGEMHPGTYGSGRFCSQSCRSRFNGRKMQANPGGPPGGGGGRGRTRPLGGSSQGGSKRRLETGDEEEEDHYAVVHNTLCQECGGVGSLLPCDFCNLVYHKTCIPVGLPHPGKGPWQCPECLREGIEDSAEGVVEGGHHKTPSTKKPRPQAIVLSPGNQYGASTKVEREEREGKRSRVIHDYSQMNQGDDLLQRVHPKSELKGGVARLHTGHRPGPHTAPAASRRRITNVKVKIKGLVPEGTYFTIQRRAPAPSPERYEAPPARERTRGPEIVSLTGMTVMQSPSPGPPGSHYLGAANSTEEPSSESPYVRDWGAAAGRRVFPTPTTTTFAPLSSGDHRPGGDVFDPSFAEKVPFDRELVNDLSVGKDLEGFVRHYLQPSPGGTRFPISPALVLGSPSPLQKHPWGGNGRVTPVEPFVPQAPGSGLKKDGGDGVCILGKVEPPKFLKPDETEQRAVNGEGETENEQARNTSAEEGSQKGADEEQEDKRRDAEEEAVEATAHDSKSDNGDSEVASDKLDNEGDDEVTRDRAGSAGSAGAMEPAKSVLESSDTVDAKGDSSSSEGQPSDAGKQTKEIVVGGTQEPAAAEVQ